jgi:hypothetical protein
VLASRRPGEVALFIQRHEVTQLPKFHNYSL